jgi:hypothetical protein
MPKPRTYENSLDATIRVINKRGQKLKADLAHKGLDQNGRPKPMRKEDPESLVRRVYTNVFAYKPPKPLKGKKAGR